MSYIIRQPVVRFTTFSEEDINYLDSCARIRKITTHRLIVRLMKVIAEEKMVMNVLDDEAKPGFLKGERRKVIKEQVDAA